MNNKTFLFEDIDNLESDAIKVLQERLFGLPDKKKTEQAQSPSEKEDTSVTPEYINSVLDSVDQVTYETISDFVEGQYNKALDRIKARNPKAFKNYLISEFGVDDESKFMKSKLAGFWKQIAVDKTGLYKNSENQDWDEEDNKSKEPFSRIFPDSLFDKDHFRTVESIIKDQFGEDFRELNNFWKAWTDENMSQKQRLIKTGGITEDSVIKRVVQLKLALIILGMKIIQVDPRFLKSFPQGGKAIEEMFDQFSKTYDLISGQSHGIANKLYNELKSKDPSEYGKGKMNPYEVAVTKITQEINGIIDEAKSSKDKDDDEEEDSIVGASRRRAERIDSEDIEDEDIEDEDIEGILDDEPEPKQAEPQEREQSEKEQEVEFANDPRHARQMLMLIPAQKAIDAIENPAVMNNLSLQEFRNMKTLFAHYNPQPSGEKQDQFGKKILSLTKGEFYDFLKSLQSNTTALSAFINLWNENKNINGQLSTSLLGKKSKNDETDTPTKTKTRAKSPAKTPTVEKKPAKKTPTKKSPTSKRSSKASDNGIGLTPTDEEDAALQSSKGIEDYFRSGKGKNLGI